MPEHVTEPETHAVWRWQRRPIRGIVFDVDGTLYLQRPLRRAMLLQLMRAYWKNPRQGWQTARLLGAYRRAQESLRGGAALPPDLAIAQLEHAVNGTVAPWQKDAVNRWMEQEPLAIMARFARPGLREFCEDARNAGLTMGVFSDYPAARKLATLGLTGYLDAVVSAQDPEVRCFKPDPIGIRVTLRRMGLSANDSIYVGDRPDVDAPAAAAAGMPCFLFAPPTAQPGSWTPVSDFFSLAKMLQDDPA